MIGLRYSIRYILFKIDKSICKFLFKISYVLSILFHLSIKSICRISESICYCLFSSINLITEVLTKLNKVIRSLLCNLVKELFYSNKSITYLT